MKKTALLLVVLIYLFAARALCQTVTETSLGRPISYALKGSVLGQTTLEQFKAEFRHCADACDGKAAKTYGPKFAPFCSDDYSRAHLTPDSADSSDLWTAAG